MILFNLLNTLTKVLLGVGIVTLWKQAAKSKIAAQKAEQLAYDKHLKEAVCVVETIVDSWSSRPGFWERLMRQLLLGNLLNQLKLQRKEWHSKISEADKLVFQAKTLLQKDGKDPLKTQALSQASALYQRYGAIAHDDKVLWEINQCQREIQHRQQFQKLVTAAEAEVQQKFFKSAIAFYHQAKQLYATEAVISAIEACFAQPRHKQVRYIVAEFLIDILIDAVNRGNAGNPEITQQLGRWAYELCPDEPTFQEVYRQLKLRY